MKLITRTCPLCKSKGRMPKTGLKISDDKYDEYVKYIEYGGSIQDVLPSFNKFEREFILTGYCSCCQEKIFGSKLKDHSMFFNFSTLRKNVIEQFIEATADYEVVDAICSEHAAKLSVNEKLVYIDDAGIEDMCSIDADGTVTRIE